MTTITPEFSRALADRYRVEREIGRGGMATVFLADDLKHGRKVAIKVMHPEMAAAIGHDRFLREIEIAARLTHPHVLPLHDSGAADGVLYYVMPYISGESLRARLDRERQLALDEALRLAREIASALGYAHHQGLVHRDVKPENVLLADGIALVADFGIARSAGRAGAITQAATQVMNTGAGLAVGTPLYMSPEQAAADVSLDGRADQYALGCVLYEMLAGQPPFSASTVSALMMRHAQDPVPPLRSVRPGVPEAVERVIAKALAKAPADRYPTMARFAEALGMAASGLRTPTPAPSSTVGESVVPNNLPKQRTSFVGRERELAECARLLGETRLLTLTGVGGCGKTRLGLKLAEGMLESFPDGTWWVDLAPIADASRVPQALAAALGLQEEPGQPLTETLQRRFENERALVVLDNCEHVLDATSALADALLSASEDLRLVITSREGLGIEGEHVVALRSLSVPSTQAQSDLHAVEASDAVKLFVDRARQAARDFGLTAASAPAVAEICRRLDGMPLAIELAAARVKMLSVEQIRAKLDDRFRLLTGGSKAMPRHQTLRATIQWSHDQLAAEEQALFRDLSVFAGGWTLQGAVAVASDSADEFEVLDLLTRLTDKSLLNVDRDESGEARYSMLETVRQFAGEQLGTSAERDAVRDRHLAHCLTLTAAFDHNARQPAIAGRDYSRDVDLELENILAAHSWCDQSRARAGAGLRLIAPLKRYWPDRGQFDLGLRLLREALARPGAEAHSIDRSQALASESDLLYYCGRYDDSLDRAREALVLARDLGEPFTLLSALDATGSAAYACGSVDEARALCTEYVAKARETGDVVSLVSGLTYLGEILRTEGQLEQTVRIYDELVPLVRRRGNPQGVCITLVNLGMTLTSLERLDEARTCLAEASSVALLTGSNRLRGSVVDSTAALVSSFGDAEAAARLLGAADRVFERNNARREPADEAFQAPRRRLAKERLGEAAFAAALAAGRELTLEAAFREASEWLERRGAAS